MFFRPCFQHLPTIERRRIPGNAPDDLRLHRGERVEPWPSEVYDAVDKAMREPGALEWYPNYAPFVEKLAAFMGVSADRIVVGAGIEEFIRTLTFLAASPTQKIAVTWPTCAMYEIYARVFGLRINRIITDPDLELTAGDILDCLDGRTRLLFLVNPGQPVDTCFGLDDLRLIAHACRSSSTILAIDEAYYGFGAPTALPLIDEFSNVIVMRTFSKAFGAASIRVGCAMGQPRMIKSLDAARPSGEISGPSMRIASVLMDMWDDTIKPAVSNICDGRDWLRTQLQSMGVKARGTVANHVLIDCMNSSRAQSIGMKLADRGIYVKSGLPAPADRHLLVTCASRPIMERFLDEVRHAAHPLADGGPGYLLRNLREVHHAPVEPFDDPPPALSPQTAESPI